jgi:hypothetical protein
MQDITILYVTDYDVVHLQGSYHDLVHGEHDGNFHGGEARR